MGTMLKLGSYLLKTIFYLIQGKPLKMMKNAFFHLKSSFRSEDI